MTLSTSFDDDLLGRVTWSADDGCWKFDAGPFAGGSLPAQYVPTDSNVPFVDDQEWENVRACVRWIRTNEPTICAFFRENHPEPAWYRDSSYREGIFAVQFLKAHEARLLARGYDGIVVVCVTKEGHFIGGPTLITWDL